MTARRGGRVLGSGGSSKGPPPTRKGWIVNTVSPSCTTVEVNGCGKFPAEAQFSGLSQGKGEGGLRGAVVRLRGGAKVRRGTLRGEEGWLDSGAESLEIRGMG